MSRTRKEKRLNEAKRYGWPAVIFAKLDAIKQPSMTQPHAKHSFARQSARKLAYEMFLAKKVYHRLPDKANSKKIKGCTIWASPLRGELQRHLEKSGLWEAFSTNALTSIVEGDKEFLPRFSEEYFDSFRHLERNQKTIFMYRWISREIEFIEGAATFEDVYKEWESYESKTSDELGYENGELEITARDCAKSFGMRERRGRMTAR
jgi:hypothetical protein